MPPKRAAGPGARPRSGDEGFSLVELLVVLVIIAILAAIAIPVFVAQREKGWRGQVESALRNGATIMQAWHTENDGDYSLPAGVGPDAEDEMAWMDGSGWPPTEEVTVDVVNADAEGFCLHGSHSQMPGLHLEYDSDAGAPVDGDCS